MILIKDAPTQTLEHFLDSNNITLEIKQESKGRYILRTSPYMLYHWNPEGGYSERDIYGVSPEKCVCSFIEDASCHDMKYRYNFFRRRREGMEKFIDVPNLVLTKGN